MKRFFSFLVMMFAATSVMLAAEGGKLTSSKTPINPTETVTLNYDGTGTNFANWEPQCFVHAWLEAAEGKTFSKEYRPAWASCNGDEDYKNLDAKVKMTLVEKGKYTIDINIKDFFDVAEADLENIGKLGIIVRAQYEGDNNKTNDLFLDVAVSAGGGEGGDTPEPPTPGTVYYMKNNWGAGADWTWKAMTQDGETYKLESVIFGGNGVNYNTAESDEGATWVPADQILGDKIAANDTVTFVLDPVAKTVTATLVSAGGDTPEPPTPGTVYYMKNNWGAGADWTWKAMTQDGETYKLESVIFGGTGVNYNTAESDEGATWVPADQILGDKIAAKDTVTFVLDPVAKTVTATLVSAGGGTPEPPTPEEHTYTVAGSSTDLFDTAWAPTNEANDMVLVEGLYTWEKTDLTLAAGSIEFKVCEDHAWTNSWPAQNDNLTIPEAGIYTITITFNAESKEVNAVATKTGSAVVIPTVAMHGNFLGSWADTENFTVAEDNATASLTLTIAAGDYEFGMRIGGAGNWTANGAEFSRQNPSAVVVAGQGNLKLAADEAGEYTFTWTFATNTLAITFPTPTGFEETVAAEKATKILRNGQIFILKGDKIYNVMGGTIK